MKRKLFWEITFLSLLGLMVNLRTTAQKTGIFETSIIYGGVKHIIAYSVPTTYDQSNKYPIIVGLHGCPLLATDFRNALKYLATKANAIVMCPDNFGIEISDIGFIKNSIDSAKSLYSIDTTMVFLTGFSCGGAEVLKLGLNHSYKFRGIMPWDPYTQGVSDFNNYDVDMPVVIAAGNIDPSFGMDLYLYDSLKVHGSKVNLIDIHGVAHELPDNLSDILYKSYLYLTDSNNISISPVPDIEIYPNSPEQTVTIKNIKHKRNAELEIAADNVNSYVTSPVVNYTSGSDNATITFKPNSSIKTISKTKIIVEVKEKNGNGIKQVVINITVKIKPKFPVSASSQLSYNTGPENAIDKNKSTYWKSKATDNEWLCVDLTKVITVKGVIINWASYGISYKIQVSTDSLSWVDAYSTTTGAGKNETIKFDPVQTRYIRLLGTQSQFSRGYQISEFQPDTGQSVDIKNKYFNNENSQFELFPSILNSRNRVTTISYSLSIPSQVNIAIYNIQGKEIKTLVNKYQIAGNYSINWIVSNEQGTFISPGVYFCKMSTRNFQGQNKILILK